MAFEVAHDVAGDLLALVVNRGHGTDLVQQCRRLSRAEAHVGATGVEVAEQDVQAVDPPGVLGNQVVAALGKQSHDRVVVLELYAVEAPIVQRNRRD
jgi:hypothetical protein